MNDTPKEIKIVSGDGKDLEISPVYKHLPIQKPKSKDKKDVIIPKEKKQWVNHSLFNILYNIIQMYLLDVMYNSLVY